ncbi:MAG TPA: TrkA C-terminal domain-containing protein [Polyangia bacterium]|nr:TrkA C-terminal domain-containing protein [Polyangia bacterium]
MHRITFWDRLRYRFDNAMARGTVTMIAGLGLLSAVLILAISLFVWLTGIAPAGENGTPIGLIEVLWMSLLRTLDPGTMGGDKGRWSFLIAMLAVTLGGVFLVSAFIGVLTSGIENRLEELRKGRSVVAEQGHTIILGWSAQVFAVLQELIYANANQRHTCVAILADKDKGEMDDEIRARLPDSGRTHIVCRHGDPLDTNDLAVVNPTAARSIIVLSPEGEDADLRVIKTLLALIGSRGQRREPYHIVAQMREARNMEVARMVGKGEVALVLTGEFISRIAVQTCRQSGLSAVYTELLNFSGDEIYFQDEPALVGKTFGEALFLYEDSTLIGLRKKDGRIQMNPPPGTLIEAGDKVIVISEDDDTIHLSQAASARGQGHPSVDTTSIRVKSETAPQPERMLILGWNRWAATVIKELDNYVAPGSEVTVVAGELAVTAETELGEECANLTRQKLTFQRGDIADRRVLDRLQVPTYDHVMVLSYADHLEPQEADAQTLVTLLHLRDIANRSDRKFSVVSQMLDVRNRDLAEVAQIDDFIVSDTLVSLLVSQIAENPELATVFADLFMSRGSGLYLRPAADYVAPYRPISFYTVVESARRRGEVAIGYRLRSQAEDASRDYGVKVNPKKSTTVAFGAEDQVIILGRGTREEAPAQGSAGTEETAAGTAA